MRWALRQHSPMRHSADWGEQVQSFGSPSFTLYKSQQEKTPKQQESQYVWGQSEQQEQGDEAVEQETGHGSTPEHTGLLSWITRPLPVWWPWGGMVVVICSLPGGKAEVVTNTVYRASFGPEQTHMQWHACRPTSSSCPSCLQHCWLILVIT